MRSIRLIPIGAGLLTAVLLLILMRRGPVQFLDAGSYASAIDAIAHGRGFSTGLAPSFSNISVVEFAQEGGRVPFVDFPLGYPIVAAIPAVVLGARHAMIAVAVVSAALLVAIVTHGPRRTRTRQPDELPRRLVRALLGIGIVCLPMFQAVTRAGLSEPLFCVLIVAVLALVIDADKHPDGLRLAVVLAGAAGAVRFVGLPIVAVPALLMVRHLGVRKALPWVGGAVLPAVANVAWSSAVGTGHVLGLRHVSSIDVRFFVHSIGGWADHRYGVFDLLLSGSGRPPIWAYGLAVLWGAGAVIALISLCLRKAWLPRPVELALVLAGTLTAGLFAGIALFDSLVAPDNRLMLPAGVVTLVGLGWWLVDQVQLPAAAAVIAVWVAVAAAPWQLSVAQATPTDPALTRAVGTARLVISDSADTVWWQTGVASAYLPLPNRLLTGDPVDQRAELAALPCLLLEHDGVILLVGGPFVDSSTSGLLSDMVSRGQLRMTPFGTIRRFTPTRC